MSDERVWIHCYHCGNETPHSVLLRHEAMKTWGLDSTEAERYEYLAVSCETCGDLALLGKYSPRFAVTPPPGVELPQPEPRKGFERLYPRGPHFVPECADMGDAHPVPSHIFDLYQNAWPLCRSAPDAFATQVRRALELVCDDYEGRGNRLHDKLRDLAFKGLFPKELAEIAHLIRDLGNRSAHGAVPAADRYAAELLDQLFQSLLTYLYVSPRLHDYLKKRPWKW